MTRLTDGKKSVAIAMRVWQDSGYSPDWSLDFFDAGLLPYDRETDMYTVKDVDYCIEAAKEWEAENENNAVFVEEVITNEV